jgi:hypothetical protein
MPAFERRVPETLPALPPLEDPWMEDSMRGHDVRDAESARLGTGDDVCKRSGTVENDDIRPTECRRQRPRPAQPSGQGVPDTDHLDAFRPIQVDGLPIDDETDIDPGRRERTAPTSHRARRSELALQCVRVVGDDLLRGPLGPLRPR